MALEWNWAKNSLRTSCWSAGYLLPGSWERDCYLYINQVWHGAYCLVQPFYFLLSKTLWMKTAGHWFPRGHHFLVLLSRISRERGPCYKMVRVPLTLWVTGVAAVSIPALQRLVYMVLLVYRFNHWPNLYQVRDTMVHAKVTTYIPALHWNPVSLTTQPCSHQRRILTCDLCFHRCRAYHRQTIGPLTLELGCIFLWHPHNIHVSRMFDLTWSHEVHM